ncbi:MAG: ABC transporter permease [Syntrophorhabdaceae bacterium]|nr:ABC transporter permease [Syntrophorhabdaceae bacterium]HOC45883.1 ABC transporter permease [Syntrophorhabdaceae bacterium]
MALFQKISQLKEFVEEVIRILYYYRGRAVFSFSGVALGILSICIIVTTIDGANKKAQEIFEMLGPDSIMIFGVGEKQRAARIRTSTLKVEDADLIARVEGIYDLMRVYSARNVMMRYRDRNWQTLVIGSTTNYFDSLAWKFQTGVTYTAEDYANAGAVCVIGARVYDELFKDEDPLGKTILVGKLPTRVIGVLEERGGSFGGPHVDDRIIMPLTTVTSRIVNEKRYLSLVRVKTNRDLDRTIEDIRITLRQSHGLQGSLDDDFTLRSSKDILAFVTVISGSLLLFLGTAAVVALVVSGFVLANLFYLNIQERKKDIGIRRAYGATRKGILLSFLFESVLITFIGGVAGILLSVVLGSTFENLFDIPMMFSLKVVVFALFFSFLTGVLSGLKPALTASRIEPIEAIRG